EPLLGRVRAVERRRRWPKAPDSRVLSHVLERRLVARGLELDDLDTAAEPEHKAIGHAAMAGRHEFIRPAAELAHLLDEVGLDLGFADDAVQAPGHSSSPSRSLKSSSRGRVCS